MVNVICMKWGTKYGPEYVNNLRSMVQRHLKRPHRFVCFTEDKTGVRDDVEIRPLPTMDLPPDKERGWRKLSTFQNPLFDLTGTTLFIDLDVVIVGSLDEFFDLPGKFVIIRDWIKPTKTGNSSVYRFEAGAHPDVVQFFLDHIDDVKREVRNEQEYLTREMNKRGLTAYWPKEWCQSFKYCCLPTFPLNFFAVPKLPPAARIIVFHGKPNPPDAITGQPGLRRFVKPTPWVAEHWK